MAYVRRSKTKQEMGIFEQLQWARGTASDFGVRLDGTEDDLQLMVADGACERGGLFLDDGISGSLMDRPGFAAFRRAALKDKRVSHVFIHMSDRFARPELAVEPMKMEIELLLAGITVVFSNRVSQPRERGLHYFPEDIQLLHEYSNNGEFLTKLATRVLQALARLAQGGHWTGGRAPYGFVRVLVDARKEIVRELHDGETVKMPGCHVRIMPKDMEKIRTWLYILDLHGNHGWGHSRIANHLNDLGIPSPDAGRTHCTSTGRPPSGRWASESVKRLITSRAIVGEVTFGKTAVGTHRRLGGDGPRLLNDADRDADGSPKRTTGDKPITAATGFEPTADLDLFERCQALTEQRGRSQRGIPRGTDLSRYPLSTRIFDVSPGCGAMLYGSKSDASLKYECSRYRQSGGRECHRNTVDAEPMLRFVLRLLRQQLEKYGGRAALRERLRAIAESERPKRSQTAIDELRLTEDRLAARRSELRTIEANLARASNETVFRAIEGEHALAKTEVDRLQERLSQLQSRSAKTERERDVDAEVDAAMALLDRIEAPADDADARRELARVLRTLDLNAYLRFRPNPYGRRPLRAVEGGFVTIGQRPDPRGADTIPEEGRPPDADENGGDSSSPPASGTAPLPPSRRREGPSLRKPTHDEPSVAPGAICTSSEHSCSRGVPIVTELPDDVKLVLDRLLALVPPPLPRPARAAASPEVMKTVRGLPSDLVHLVSSYGSGQFLHKRLGCLVEVYDPFGQYYKILVKDAHASLREYRDVEGDEMVPYPVHPKTPGLRIWGRNDSSDRFLWLTEGKPDAWPVMYFGDMRKMVRFDMPVVVFLENVFTGKITRTQLCYATGPDDLLDPADITFVPW